MAASRSTLSDLKEQLLAWPLAISLLSVSGYHYLQSILKSFHIRRLLGSYASASPPPFSSHYFLPITTLSYTEKHEISPKNIDSYIHKLLPKLSKSAILSNPQARKLFNQILSSSSFSSITHDPKNLLVGLYPVIINTPPLPPDLSNFSNTSNTTLSVIVPCYNESLPSLCETLTANLQRTSAPSLVEVVIVDAGGHSPNFEATIKAAIGELCAVSFVAHRKGGGRGPAQNAGAQYASSPLLSFLHADTLLPLSWDTKIIKTLMKPGVSSCAFNFGIAPSGGDSGEVPGIRAIAVTANLRTRLYDLPYGDQCLSISKQMFEYVGGFPNNCLMEDYDLIAVLRMRARVRRGVEKLEIIEGDPVLCSPRRWEKLGVLLTTFTNSSIVNSCARGIDPDKLYKEYYGQEPPPKLIE